MRSPAIPVDGVVREGDGTMTVWVTADRRRFTRRTVKIGEQRDGYRQILDGVQVGELVATEGALSSATSLPSLSERAVAKEYVLRISFHILVSVLLGAATLPATAQFPAVTPGVPGDSPGGFVNASGRPGVPKSVHPYPSPIVTTTAPNRGKIGGAALNSSRVRAIWLGRASKNSYRD